MRPILADEFARRLKVVCKQNDKRHAFFIGAGCSISSGIPDSNHLVKEVWLPMLRDLRAPERKDLEQWASSLLGYDGKNPAASYGKVIETLFLQPEDRQHEIERLCNGHFPGFGYATLARLMTIDGGHFNIVLTTNFDDLVSDALYLYTDARPLVIHHESLASFIRPTRTRPLVIKLHGDNRLSPQNTSAETAKLKEEVQNHIISALNDRGLIFVGYGGNDQSIIRMLKSMPNEALPLGVYWVSGVEPEGPIREWLDLRNAVWVNQADFDQLMCLIKHEFELPDPDGKRFEAVFENYANTHEQLSLKIAALPDSAPDAVALKEAIERSGEEFEDFLAKIRQMGFG